MSSQHVKVLMVTKPFGFLLWSFHLLAFHTALDPTFHIFVNTRSPVLCDEVRVHLCKAKMLTHWNIVELTKFQSKFDLACEY
ncbi:hypothetical protein QOT17_013786 [Balamuthia mandrillaris]